MPLFDWREFLETVEKLCILDSCCGCFPLRTGAIGALILSICVDIAMILWAVWEIVAGTKGVGTSLTNATVDKVFDPYNYALHIFCATLLLLVAIMFAIGTVFLYLSIVKNRSILVMIWLIKAMVFIIMVVACSFLILDDKTTWLDLVLYLMLVAAIIILVYLWMVVLNFYWSIRNVEIAEEAWKTECDDEYCGPVDDSEKEQSNATPSTA